jgi:hypothetical protein
MKLKAMEPASWQITTAPIIPASWQIATVPIIPITCMPCKTL